MSVKITDNHPKIQASTSQAVNLALRFMVDAIDKQAFRKTPKDQGELRKNILKNVSGHSAFIKWKSEYAAYQERGYTSGPVRRYTTPGTGPHFAENAVDKVTSQANVYLKKARVI